MAHTCSVCSLCVDLTPWNQAHVHRRHTPNARAQKAYTTRTEGIHHTCTEGIHQTHKRHTPNARKAYTKRMEGIHHTCMEGIHQTQGRHTPNARNAYTKRTEGIHQTHVKFEKEVPGFLCCTKMHLCPHKSIHKNFKLYTEIMSMPFCMYISQSLQGFDSQVRNWRGL